MTDKSSIESNLKAVLDRIDRSAKSCDRKSDDITLMAVSKTKDAVAIRRAIAAGQTCFGENRLQEAMDKWPEIKADHPDLQLHLIGPLQSNKVRAAVKLFDVIHSVDRPKIAHSLARIMEEENRHIPLYIQVNTGDEPQKAGISPQDLDDFVDLCVNELKLPIIGLMAIPPVDDHPGPHFAFLAKLAEKYGLKGLSMGMTNDFEQAILLGATIVRVGSAIFGARSQ